MHVWAHAVRGKLLITRTAGETSGRLCLMHGEAQSTHIMALQQASKKLGAAGSQHELHLVHRVQGLKRLPHAVSAAGSQSLAAVRSLSVWCRRLCWGREARQAGEPA